MAIDKVARNVSQLQQRNSESTQLRITQYDLDCARQILMDNDNNPIPAYEFLASKDDRFAKLALGVIREDTISGRAAVTYLESVANEYGVSININVIPSTVINNYIDIQQTRLDDSGNEVIYGDIDHKQAGKIHEDAFKEYGLPAKAWTLEPIFKVLSESESEEFWQDTLKQKDVADETLFAFNTAKMMIGQLETAPAALQPDIHDWLWKIGNYKNFDAVTTTIGRALTKDVNERIDRIKEALTGTTSEPDTLVVPQCNIDPSSYAPKIDHANRSASHFSFGNSQHNNNKFSHNAPLGHSLSSYHLERPSYILPEKALFSSPILNYSPSDRLSSMMSSFERLGGGSNYHYTPLPVTQFSYHSMLGGFR